MMSKEDIAGGIKIALSRGSTLQDAMQSFYNAGYKKEEIEAAARELQTQGFRPRTVDTLSQTFPKKTLSIKNSATTPSAPKLQPVMQKTKPLTPTPPLPSPPLSAPSKPIAAVSSFSATQQPLSSGQTTVQNVSPPAVPSNESEAHNQPDRKEEDSREENSKIMPQRVSPKDLSRPPTPEEIAQRVPKQAVSQYGGQEEKKEGGVDFITIILIIILLLLVGVLVGVFLFRDALVEFLGNFLE